MGLAQDHERLAAVLLATPAAVVLSGYPNPLYERLYADWWRINVHVRVHASNAVTIARGERTEVVWCNRPVDLRHLPFAAHRFATHQRESNRTGWKSGQLGTQPDSEPVYVPGMTPGG